MIEYLEKSQNVLIASHIHPDGDAIGSVLSLGLALSSLGKNVTLFNECPVPKVYRFLFWEDKIITHLDSIEPFDTAIILDCADIKRLGEHAQLISKIPIIINIDHHSTNTGFGTYKKIDTNACATSEIIYFLLKEMAVEITPEIAEAIYVGIMTDTGSFRFANTNQSAFDISKEMVRLGADPYKTADQIFGTYSLGSLKLLHRVLGSIQVSKNGKLSVLSLTQEMMDETDTAPEDIIGLIHYAKHIKDVKVAALIQEAPQNRRGCAKDSTFHVSLRSDGSVDVAEIANKYGGGGHPNAAGFSVKTTYIELVKSMFKNAKYI